MRPQGEAHVIIVKAAPAGRGSAWLTEDVDGDESVAIEVAFQRQRSTTESE